MFTLVSFYVPSILIIGGLYMSKLASRKFWICAAAFLASLGTSITALRSDNEIIAAIGLVCTIASAAVYATAEAYVDGNTRITRDDDDRSGE